MKITVIPESKKNKITQLGEDRYEVRLKVKPERNQANLALIELLAEYFHLPSTSIHITAGHHSHHKRVIINP